MIAIPQHESKTKLLNAALHVIRAKGYSATTIDDVCNTAQLTKGSFFHHFKSKEDLAVAAAGHFSDMADSLFTNAPYWAKADPLDRLLGYVDFRQAMLQGALPDFTCLLGTMVQEAYATHPSIRAACNEGIRQNAAMVETFVAAAMCQHGVPSGWSASSLALYTQAVLQGAFILAKAQGGPAVAVECLAHLRRYIELLFAQPHSMEKAA